MLLLWLLVLVQVPRGSSSVALSREERRNLSCEQLKYKARELGLLLSEDKGSPGSVCELSWDPERVVNAGEGRNICETSNLDQYVCTVLIEISTLGQILVVSPGTQGLPLSAQINQSQYILIGGIARFFDRDRQALSYHPFTADKTEISCNRFEHMPFIRRPERASCFDGSQLRRDEHMLPSSVVIHDGTTISITYEYGLYQDVGPLETPYDLQHLRLNDKLVNMNDLKNLHGIPSSLHMRFVAQAISLIRFIQLLDAFNAEYILENPGLNDLRSKLQALKVEVTEKKTKDMLLEACAFIFHSHCNDISSKHPFLSILMQREPIMRNFIFFDEEYPFYPGSKVEEYVCDGDLLLDRMMFYASSDLSSETLPQFLSVDCPGEPGRAVSLELLAAIDCKGNMITFGSGASLPRNEKIYRIARYADKPHVQIVNFPIRESHTPLTVSGHYLYIYHSVNMRRFGRMKRALDQ